MTRTETAIRWLLRIIGLPGIITLLVLIIYIYDRKTNTDALQPKINVISHAFFGVFFVSTTRQILCVVGAFCFCAEWCCWGSWSMQCYPTICIVSFAAFICKAVTPTLSVLSSDDQVFCTDGVHVTIQWFSGFVIVFIAFGLPALFLYIMIRAVVKYDKTSRQSHLAMARRVAKDMDVDVSTAQ